MITVLVLTLLFGLGINLFVSKQRLALVILASLLGAAVGFFIAVIIGDKMPTKTTVTLSAPLETINIEGEQNVYLEMIEVDDYTVYIYQVEGDLYTKLPGVQRTVVFVSQVKPYIEYTEMEFDHADGQGWKELFGFWNLTHHKRGVTFYLPEESVYVVKN